jgi:hypothetical protein
MTIAVNTLSTTASAIYTSAGNTAITSLTLCNYSTSNVTANLFVVPNSSAPTTNNIMLANLLIQSSDTYQIYSAAEKLVLGPGDAIYADAQIANTISTITSYTSI